MIKQTWQISEGERKRILNLHESATKKLYLIKEQDEQPKGKMWKLCSAIITQVGDRYFAQIGEPSPIEIPKLSEVQGVVQGGKLDLSQLTKNGLKVGKWMNTPEGDNPRCSNNYPRQYERVTQKNWFCWIDDVSEVLTKDSSGREKLVPTEPTPFYGLLSWDGTLRTGGGEFMGETIPKDKNGLVVKYRESRTRSFFLEVATSVPGKPFYGYEKPEPVPTFKAKEFNYQNPFVFDKTELTPEAEQEFKKFIDIIKTDYNGVKGNVEIITSASIDAEPTSKEDYNMELSKRRANAIIERLKNETGNTSLTFIPKPIGQTDMFAPGKKFPDFKPKDTAPNRRLIIKLPTIYE